MSRLLTSGGAAARACALILTHFELETAVDILVAASDEEVREFVVGVSQADPAVAEAWPRLVRWAGADEAVRKSRIHQAALAGMSDAAPAQAPPTGKAKARPAPALAPPPAKRLTTSRARVREAAAVTEVAKRRRMAMRVLDIIRKAGTSSSLTKEREDATADTEQWDWAYTEILTGSDGQAGFEATTLQKAASTWARWLAWHESHLGAKVSCPYQPAALTMRNFLKKVSANGPTAATGAWQSLSWLRQHAGLVHLPMGTPLVEAFRHAKAGHQVRQQDPLKIEAFTALIDILEDAHTPPWKSCAAALVGRVLLSCLRWAHVERATALPQESTGRTQVWSITKGKGADRAGFKVSTPTHIAPDLPLGRFLRVLSGMPEHDRLHLVPDIHIGPGGLEGECAPGAGRMTRLKFMSIATHLLQPTHLQPIRGYTLRRWLPSIAGALQLPLERRRDLGNWKDVLGEGQQRVQEPMSVRYNACRLEATASVKRLCLGAVLHLAKWASAQKVAPSFAKLEGCIRSLASLERHGARAAWGIEVAPQASDEAEEELPPLVDEVTSSASSESSTSASTPGTSDNENEPSLHSAPSGRAAELAVLWLAPHRSTLIHVARPTQLKSRHAEVTPLCKDVPFTAGYDEGQGVTAAASLGKEWCPSCLRKLDLLPDDAYGQQPEILLQAALDKAAIDKEVQD